MFNYCITNCLADFAHAVTRDLIEFQCKVNVYCLNFRKWNTFSMSISLFICHGKGLALKMLADKSVAATGAQKIRAEFLFEYF